MINLNISARGSKWWYCKTYLHRLNGPAITCFDGHTEWFMYGKLHRLNGPARTYVGGYVEYWMYGKYLDDYAMMFLDCQGCSI